MQATWPLALSVPRACLNNDFGCHAQINRVKKHHVKLKPKVWILQESRKCDGIPFAAAQPMGLRSIARLIGDTQGVIEEVAN
jgi:hypothetical protein